MSVLPVACSASNVHDASDGRSSSWSCARRGARLGCQAAARGARSVARRDPGTESLRTARLAALHSAAVRLIREVSNLLSKLGPRRFGRAEPNDDREGTLVAPAFPVEVFPDCCHEPGTTQPCLDIDPARRSDLAPSSRAHDRKSTLPRNETRKLIRTKHPARDWQRFRSRIGCAQPATGSSNAASTSHMIGFPTPTARKAPAATCPPLAAGREKGAPGNVHPWRQEPRSEAGAGLVGA